MENEIIKKRVGFAYSRLSQKDRHKVNKEELESSLINAKRDIEVYCKNNDVELIYFGEERYKSGAKWDRHVVQKTILQAKQYSLDHIEDVQNGKLEVQFIIKNLSRIAREGVFQELTLREMEDPPYYIRVVSIEEGEVVKDKSLRMMIGAMNEHKVSQGRKEAEKRHNEALSMGKPPIKAPFGYWNDKNEHNWKIDKKDAKIVLDFWKMFAEGKNYKEICQKLVISSGKYYRILDNFENYLGKIIYRKKIKNHKGRIFQVKKDVYDGSHKPILNDEILIQKIKNKLTG